MWAISVAVNLWLKIEPVLKSIEDFQWVAWRMDPIYTEWVKYFVDFAHTPDWLEKALTFASRNKWNGRLITICWAPWNRDKEKRPIMWEIAVKYSDVIIFTDDDPDTENRLSILNQLSKTIQEQGYSSKKKVYIIPERKYALEFAIEIANQWDTVVSCGKGHEQIQLTNFWKRKWNDKSILTDSLLSRNKKILNSKEIKKAYLQQLKIEKSKNSITKEQYYSTEDTTENKDSQPTQTRSWMFKPIE